MKTRIISAIIMLIIVVPILILGSWPFYIFATTLGILSLYELLNLSNRMPLYIKIISYIITGLLILFNPYASSIQDGYVVKLFVIPLIIYLAMLVFINDFKKYHYKDAFFLIGISLFIGIVFHSFIILRNQSIYTIIYLILITTLTDTFALLFGKRFGKHKLASSISPKKTIEGLIFGSLISTTLSSLFYIFVIKDYSNIFILILVTLFLTLIGQLGDLILSSIKRYVGIKDFSNLIPGHGGILDRLDSIIFVIITYILISGLL